MPKSQSCSQEQHRFPTHRNNWLGIFGPSEIVGGGDLHRCPLAPFSTHRNHVRVPQVLSLFFTLEKDARDLGHLHELFRQVMTRLIAEDKEVCTCSLYVEMRQLALVA